MPTVYRKCSNALIQRGIGEECVLLNTASGLLHQLNPAATCIWQKLADDMDIESIAGILVTDFSIDSETALADAVGFVNQLTKLELLEEIKI